MKVREFNRYVRRYRPTHPGVFRNSKGFVGATNQHLVTVTQHKFTLCRVKSLRPLRVSLDYQFGGFRLQTTKHVEFSFKKEMIENTFGSYL